MFSETVRAAIFTTLLAGAMVGVAAPAAAQSFSAPCEGGMAGPYPCENVDLESFVSLPELGGATGNDTWGWVDPQTGREYAIVGTSFGTGFVDVTDAKNPVVVGRLPTQGIPDFVLWREIDVDGNYAFIVSEISGSGLQVFDLRRLREGTPTTIYTSDATYEEFDHAHNIAINQDSDTAYVVGSDTCISNEGTEEEEAGGLHMVDISDPLNPAFLGCAIVEEPDANPDGSNNYAHDVQCVNYAGPDADYQGREICLGSNENAVVIYDVTDKANPVVVSEVPYDTAAYTHQGQLTEDRQHFLFGDELDEGVASSGGGGTVENTTTYILDVGDLDAPGVPKPFSHETSSIDHNQYVHEGRTYQSNYTAGLRILEYDDASLAAGQLREVAFFDVVPGVDVNEFAGTWSNYPYFPSGIVTVSTIENLASGLFVLRPTLPGDDPPPGGGDGPCANAIAGGKASEQLEGTTASDRISGRGGRDEIRGRRGDDCLRGGGGRDRVRGGGGGDELKGGRGKDRLKGGGGDDEIRARRGARDRINCGPGRDVVVANKRKDRIAANCEQVKGS